MHLKVEKDNGEIISQYNVIDLNNGTRIPCVQEANDETGEFSLYLRDEIGDLLWDKDRNPILFKFKGNIKLLKKEN